MTNGITIKIEENVYRRLNKYKHLKEQRSISAAIEILLNAVDAPLPEAA